MTEVCDLTLSFYCTTLTEKQLEYLVNIMKEKLNTELYDMNHPNPDDITNTYLISNEETR